MKRLRGILLAEILTAVVLGVLLAVLLFTMPKSGAESIVFSDHAITDIVSVQLENENGSITVSTQDGGFVVQEVPSELVGIDTFIDFLSACVQVPAEQKLAGRAKDAEQYGLEAPQSQLTVSYADGETLTIQVGSLESVSGNYYCAVNGDDSIYLLSPEYVQWYLIAKETLISFEITPKLQVSSALSALKDVTFSGAEYETPVTIESVSSGDEEVKRTAISFGAATHIVRGAGVYELDQTYALTMLEPLCGMSGQSIAAYGLTEEELNEIGFGDPYLKVEFDYKNGTETAEHYVLRFLPANESGTVFYVNSSGSSVVYLVERPAFMDLTYEKLFLRWFLTPLLMDISGVAVESPAGTFDFAVDNTDAKNPVVTMNGEALDTGRFRSLFKLLCSAANDGNYLGVQPAPTEENAVMTITYRYRDEAKEDDTMVLYRGDARRVNVYINGVCEFAMKDTFAERVNQALSALQTGEDFDINW